MRRLKAWLLLSLFSLSFALSIESAHAATYTYGSSFTTSMGSFTFYGIYQAGGGSISPNTESSGLLPGIGGGFPTGWMTIDMSKVIHSGVGAYVALTSSPVSFVGSSKTVSLGIVSTGSSGVWPKLTLALADSSGAHPYAFLYAEVSILYGTQVYLRSYAPGRCFGTDWCTEGTWGFGVSTGSSVSLGIQISNQKVVSTGNYVWSATVNGQTFTANTYGAQAPPGPVYWIWGSWPYGTTGQWQNGQVAVDVGYIQSCGFSVGTSGSISVTQGQSGSNTVTVTTTSGSCTGITFQTSGLPSGATASYNPSTGNPTFSSTLTISTSSSTPTGSYAITVTASAGSVSSQTTFTLTVGSGNSCGDFYISASPSSRSISPGQQTTYSISVSAMSGRSCWVGESVSISPNPGAGFFTFASGGGYPSFTDTLTVSNTQNLAAGTYTLTVTATETGYAHSSSVTLIVSTGFDFSFNNPVGIVVSPGGSGSTTVTATLVSGSTQSVSLSVSGLPSGASASFNPQSGYPTFSTALTVATSSSTPTGSYTLTATGTGGNPTVSHTTTLSLTVKQSSSQSRVCTYVNPNSVSGSPIVIGGLAYGNGQVASINVNQWYSLQANVPGGYSFSGWGVSGSLSVQNTGASSTSVESTSSGNPSCDGDLSLNLNSQSTTTITITSGPATGSGFVSVDGSPVTTPYTQSWTTGSTHTIIANSPVGCGAGCQYVWQSWSDGGTQSHQITAPSVSTTYTAIFAQQYYLAMQVSPSTAGTVAPSSGWQNAGAIVQISATANSGSTPFSSWAGSGSGSYSGSSNPATVTINGPITETANFGATDSVTVTSTPIGSGYVVVDGSPIATPQTFSWVVGSTHTLIAQSAVSCGSGCQYVWQSWSDNGAQSHTITALSTPITYTATFQQQYQLTMQVNPSGAGTTNPFGTSWQNAGATVQISATATGSMPFSLWSGEGGSGSYSGSSNPAQVAMNAAITETAIFGGTQSVTMTVSYRVNGGGSPTAPTFSYVQGRTSRSLQLAMVPTPVSVDAGSSWSVTPNPLGGSTSSERWYSSQTLSGTAVNGTWLFAFQDQYALTMAVYPAGAGSTTPTVSGSPWWENSSASITISATANLSYNFTTWTASGINGYSGSNNPATFIISSAVTETANFKTSSGFDFSLSATPNPATVQQGETAQVTVTVSLLGSPTQSVSLSVSDWSGNSGLNGTFSPSSGSPTFTSALTIFASSSASLGTFTVTIQGVGGGLTRIFELPVTVSAKSATYTVTFHVNPPNVGGSITVTGASTQFQSTFTDGQSASLAAGSYQIQSNPPGSYAFSSWSTSGGCSVSGNTLTLSGSNGTVTMNLQSSGSGQFDFVVWPSPVTEKIQPGETANFTVTALLLSGKSQPVTLTVDQLTLPSGVVASLSQTSGQPTFTSTLTLTTQSTVAVGEYPVTLTGSAGSDVTRTVQLLLKVAQNLGADFLLGESPAALSINPAAQLTFEVTASALRGYSFSINLGSSGTPSAVTVQFNPSGGDAGFTSTATVSVGATATPGWYLFEVTGTGGDGVIHVAHFLLVVIDQGSTPSFTQTLRPPDMVVGIPDSGSSSGTLATYLNSLSGFSDTVSLAVSGVPSGTVASVNPASVPSLPGSSTLSVTAQSTAQEGVYILSTTGSDGGGLRREADFALILFQQGSSSQQVSVTILQPVDSATVSGTAVQVLANITNRLYGPGVIVNASFRVQGSGYDSGWVNMSRVDNWDWQAYWDSTKATLGEAGPYTLMVQGTSFFDNATVTGQVSITIYVDNAGYQQPLTYYVNYASNPSGQYPTGWYPETRFVPGEAIGIRYPTTCNGVVYAYIQTSSGQNASNVVEPRLASQYSWLRQMLPSQGYVTAVFPLAGIGSTPPSYGGYRIELACVLNGQSTLLATLPFTVEGLTGSWSVLNNLDSATVTATLTFNDGNALLHRRSTYHAFGYITQMNVLVAGIVDDSGVVKVKIPYYAWTGTVNFQVAYGSAGTQFLVQTQSGQVLSQSVPYAQLGVAWSTSGQDYVETVNLNVFQKDTAVQPTDGWVILQLPELGHWSTGKGTLAGSASFTVNVLTASNLKPPLAFTVQAWIYSLSSTRIYANQYSNLRIVKEQIIAIPSITNIANQNGHLTMSGSITLGTSTMSLTNVQVVVALYKSSTTTSPAIASTSFVPSILKAGVGNPFTATFASLPSSTYLIKVTVTDLTSGQVIGTSTSQVQV